MNKVFLQDRADLDDRMAAAVSGASPSVEIVELISEAKEAAEAAGRAYSLARMTALDPSTPREEVTSARQGMADAEFQQERLKAAQMALERRLEQARQRERDGVARAEYDAARQERDELVAELRDEYPNLARRLADLLRRVRASDRRIEAVNRTGVTWLNPCEAVARGTPAHFRDDRGFIPRLTEIRLPAFMAWEPPIWPRDA